MLHRWQLVLLALGGAIAAGSAHAQSTIANTGAVTGTVTAGKPFTAAQVYLRNAEKGVTFMVYTAGGKYQAINLYPGVYDVSVARRGFASEPQKITVAAGASVKADFALKDADPAPKPGINGPSTVVGYPGRATITDKDVEFFTDYDKVYPPAAGRAVLERVCMSCHGVNFFAVRQLDRAGWDAAINMMSKRVDGADVAVAAGKMPPKDRQLLLDYLAANMGPNGKKRALAITEDMPLDEQALGKAMYVEYEMPKFGPNGRPIGQNPYFDLDGNVWMTDRGSRNGIVKLDPRNVTWEAYPLPERGIPHGITVDSKGIVWWGETVGSKFGRLDPKTGKMDRYPIDATGLFKTRGHDPIVDADDNIWLTVIRGNRLAKYDAKTGKISLYEPPTASSYPYGADKDKAGNIWMSQFTQCRMAKFDPKEEVFTEYPALTAYEEDPFCLIRRGSVDKNGMVWYGVFSNGKIGKLDPATGKMVEYKMPVAFAEPYDIWPDNDNNMWIADGAMGGAIIKFDQKSEKFTFYPAVQRGDLPKIEITREGAIWYNPRSALKGAVGVLYPDMSKMTTFEARY
jgi:streptogramin lyase/mono/diheme cytochrome c family protein